MLSLRSACLNNVARLHVLLGVLRRRGDKRVEDYFVTATPGNYTEQLDGSDSRKGKTG